MRLEELAYPHSECWTHCPHPACPSQHLHPECTCYLYHGYTARPLGGKAALAFELFHLRKHPYTYDEQRGVQEAIVSILYVPLHAVGQAGLFATTKARADRGLHALVPASLRERVNSRLDASLRLLSIQERVQLFLVGVAQVRAHLGRGNGNDDGYLT